MRASTDQHVDVHLPCGCGEHFGISERDDLVTVNDADPERAVLDDHGRRQRGRGLREEKSRLCVNSTSVRAQALQAPRADAPGFLERGEEVCADLARLARKTHVVPVSPDASNIGCDAPEVVPRLAVGGVAGREDLANLARHEELFELGREVVCAVRDVEISDHEDEHFCEGVPGTGKRAVGSEWGARRGRRRRRRDERSVRW